MADAVHIARRQSDFVQALHSASQIAQFAAPGDFSRSSRMNDFRKLPAPIHPSTGLPNAGADAKSAADPIRSLLARNIRFEWLWLTLIIAVGLALRADAIRQDAAYAYNYSSQSDSVQAYDVALSLAQGEPQGRYLGQPNFNEYSKLPGPLWAAFCAAGLYLSGSMKGTAILIVLCGTGAILLTYLLAVRTVGSGAALLAALLQATSPTAVHFSVIIHNPTVMPFLGTLLFLALWRVTQREHSRAVFWVGLLLAIMPQFHFSSVVLVPAVAVAWWLSKRRLNLKWLLLGVLVGLLFYLPYVIGEMGNHWANTRGMLAGGRHRYSADTLTAFIAPANYLVNYWAPKWAYTADEYRELARVCFGSFGGSVAANVLSTIVALFLIVGAVLLGRSTLRGVWRSPREVFARAPGVAYLVVILLVPLFSAVLVGQPFHPRYALILIAPLFGLCGAAALIWWAHPRFGRIFIALFCVVAAANIWFILQMHRFQNELIKSAPRFLPTFDNLERVYQSLRLHAGKTRVVELRDQEYLKSLSREEYPWLHQADLIQYYITIRLRQDGAAKDQSMATATYVLRRANDVDATDPTVVYRANGIAIVGSPPN